jgi:predicted TIM-barrel fold metal-dependent hydrolase
MADVWDEHWFGSTKTLDVHVAAVLTDTVAIFGAERCLFGSNFPIEKLWTSYRELVEAFRAAAAPLSTKQQDAIFRTTAARVYRL